MPSRELPDGMDTLEIGRDLVNAWLGEPTGVEGVGLAARWQMHRKVNFCDAVQRRDFDLVRRAVAANLHVVLKNQGQHTPEQITKMCRDARNVSTFRLVDFAAHMSLLCDVEEESVMLEGAGQIQKFAAEHDTQQSGGW